LTVLAVADVRVGVDIEIVRTHARLARLARRSMTDEEWLEWGAAADPARAFTQHWTRVEAYLKAIGVGLAGGLRTRPTDGWRVLGLELDATGAAANATHVGALAVESGARPVRVAWRDLATDERA
jgi:4'-phosphopantetheinyl transferase